MIAYLFILLIVLSAVVTIRTSHYGQKRYVYFFKPLTMLLIMLVALLEPAISPSYKYLILAGLLFSLAGDVFLMLPSDRFVSGLIAFLIAHLLYIVAFAAKVDGLLYWPLIPLVILGGVVYTMIYPSLEEMKIAVLLYVLVILTMAWLAWEWWAQTGQKDALIAFFGAMLFVVSDVILAFNRFRGAVKYYSALNLTTYFGAQCLLATSIGLSIWA